VARAQLKVALTDPELETRRRAKRALEKIGSAASEAQLIPAAARVLASKKPEGAAEVMLNYLPSIEEPETAIEVAQALSPLAKDKDDKADPHMVKALKDKYHIKRLAAGISLLKAGVKEEKDAALKLLADDKAVIRWHIARTVVEDNKDNKAAKDAVPALIKLAVGTSDEASLAEEMLLTLAGDEKAPTRPEGDDAKAMKRYQENWEGWWKDNGEKVDLKKVDFDGVGRSYSIACYYSYNGKQRGGKVLELKDGKVKWELDLDQVSYPYYAVKSRHDRVIICDWQGAKVSERDIKGKVLWTTQSTPNSRPVNAERLPNGHTLVVGQNSIREVDREGKETKTLYSRPQFNNDIVSAGWHRDGTYTVLLQSGGVVRLDSNGKETKNYSIGGYLGYSVGVKCHYLPNGGVVIPDYSRSKLREYDSSGKQLAEINASLPTSATKLPNGNYAYFSRSNNQMYEIKKDGTQVSTTQIATVGGGNKSPLFADRR